MQDDDQKQVARKFILLHWLFWGMVVSWIATIGSEVPFGKELLITCFTVGVLPALFAVCVLRGAMWARVFCYVLFSAVVVGNADILAKHVAFRGVGDIGGFREDEALVSIWIDMESAFLGYFDL